MACRNQSPRPNNPSLHAFPLPSCYHHLFNPQCLCPSPCFPRILSNPATSTHGQMTIIVGWREATRDSTSRKNGNRAFEMGCVSSGKEIMHKKQPLCLLQQCLRALANGIALHGWPVTPVSWPSWRSPDQCWTWLWATARGKSYFFSRSTSFSLVLTFIVTVVVILRATTGREEGKQKGRAGGKAYKSQMKWGGKEENQGRGKCLMNLYVLPSPLVKFNFQALLDPFFPFLCAGAFSRWIAWHSLIFFPNLFIWQHLL